MSKITLEPNSSGAGTFSIVSPDSNINRTLNLPDADGEFLFTDSNGDLSVDGDTFYVDSANNRVGVGTSSPQEKLDVDGNIGANTINLQNSIVIGNHQKFAQRFSIPSGFRRRVEVFVGNYSLVRVIIAATRTNSGSSDVYWEGYLSYHFNDAYSYPLHTRTSGGTISYAFSESGNNFFWDFNETGSSADGVIIFEVIEPSASFTVTDY